MKLVGQAAVVTLAALPALVMAAIVHPVGAGCSFGCDLGFFDMTITVAAISLFAVAPAAAAADFWPGPGRFQRIFGWYWLALAASFVTEPTLADIGWTPAVVCTLVGAGLLAFGYRAKGRTSGPRDSAHFLPDPPVT